MTVDEMKAEMNRQFADASIWLGAIPWPRKVLNTPAVSVEYQNIGEIIIWQDGSWTAGAGTGHTLKAAVRDHLRDLRRKAEQIGVDFNL